MKDMKYEIYIKKIFFFQNRHHGLQHFFFFPMCNSKSLFSLNECHEVVLFWTLTVTHL